MLKLLDNSLQRKKTSKRCISIFSMLYYLLFLQKADVLGPCRLWCYSNSTALTFLVCGIEGKPEV